MSLHSKNLKSTQCFNYFLKVFANKAQIFSIAFLLLVGISYVFKRLFYMDVPFGVLYFLLPVLWCFWILAFINGVKKSIVKHVLFSWVLIMASILLLLIMSSESTNNLYNSKGLDLVMFISNIPIMIPFGGVVWYSIDTFLTGYGLSIRYLQIEDFYKVWLEIMLVSIIQTVSIIFLLKIINYQFRGNKTLP